MSTNQELPPGARFADFTIDGVLGRGGMGVVYRARQERLSRLVALKVIAPHLTNDAGFRERFRREAAMAAAIDHPSILPIYEAGEFEGQPFLVMRHVPGTDLKTLIEHKGRLEPARAVEIVRDIGGALDAAHRRGLVHRDVKPANILIGEEADDEEVVYLTDFGLTKGRSDERLTQTGKWVGTVDYMAPEQIEGKDVDGRADQYALGCVLYEALTGSVPFRRDSDVQIMWAHIRDDPPKASEVRPELAPAIDAVIARSMAKDPEARYATCREFARAASEAITGRSTAAVPATGPGGTVAGGTVVDGGPTTGSGGTLVGGDAPSQAPPPSTAPRPAAAASGGGPDWLRRKPVLIGAGVVALVLVGVIAAFALGGGSGKKRIVTEIVTADAAPAPTTGAGVQETGATPSTAATPESSAAATSGPDATTPQTDTGGPVASTAPVDSTAPVESSPPSSTLFGEETFSTVEETTPADTGTAAGGFPPATAADVLALAKQPVPFVALYDLIQGGDAGTLQVAFDGDTHIAYRVQLKGQGTIWAAFRDGAIEYGCLQTPDLDEPFCNDGKDREQEYRNLIQQFVNGLLSSEAVDTNFGALAAQDPPVLSGEMAGTPVACIQSVGAGTARLCVREDSIITEVTVVENGQEVGARARRASHNARDEDFAPPASIL